MATEVPHSGNLCTPFCVAPCGHDGCWQCVAVLKSRADEQAAMELVADKKALKAKLKQAEAEAEIARLRAENGIPEKLSSKGAMSTNRQIAIAGEALAAGSVDEFDRVVKGIINKKLEETLRAQPRSIIASSAPTNPVFRSPMAGPQGHVPVSPNTATPEITQITRAALEGLVARTGGRIRMDWNGGDPVFFDRTDINLTESDLPSSIQPIARDIRHKQWDRAFEKARRIINAKDASDEDIAAAEEILRWDPGTGKPMQFMRMERTDAALMPQQVQLMGQLQQAIASLKAQGVQPTAAIVHPDVAKELGF